MTFRSDGTEFPKRESDVFGFTPAHGQIQKTRLGLGLVLLLIKANETVDECAVLPDRRGPTAPVGQWTQPLLPELKPSGRLSPASLLHQCRHHSDPVPPSLPPPAHPATHTHTHTHFTYILIYIYIIFILSHKVHWKCSMIILSTVHNLLSHSSSLRALTC